MNPIKGWLADAEKSPDTRHVDTCDGVRALAICIVAWYHIWQQSWLYPNLTVFGREISFDPLVRSGYIWVDMMILISGFCLYLPWARLGEGEKGQSPAAFYEKRLARVHPSYLLTIAVMLGVALATRAYGDNRSFMLRDVASHLTYTQMFAYDTYYATNLGGSLWTLALEMQLYLIFPLLARAFRRQPAATFAAMMGIALAARGYIAATYPDVSLYFNQLPAYLDTFALGMAAAGLLGKLLPEESELAARFGQGRDPARAAAMRTALITGAALLLHNFPEGVLTFFAGTADPALGLRTAAAIALHNIPEGLAVGVAFGALQRGASPEAVMGAVSIAFGIGLQNFPEGAAVSMPLRREGAGRLRSFLLGQASGLVEPVAGVLGALLVGSVEAILPYALAFAAGAMILVAVHELIPECQRNREARPYTATMGIVAGFAIMMLLDVALG